jgi:L-amino acid N-acyltransferase
VSVTIRPATSDDVPAILRIYNAAVEATTATWDHEPVSLDDRLARYEAAQANGWALLVAEDDGRVVGFGAWSPFRAKVGWSKTMEHSVYVDAAARGSGTGQGLLQALVEAARAGGVHTLIGVVEASNAASLRLHERLGFVEVARMPQVGFKFGRWLDAVFVQLTLDDATTP